MTYRLIQHPDPALFNLTPVGYIALLSVIAWVLAGLIVIHTQRPKRPAYRVTNRNWYTWTAAEKMLATGQWYESPEGSDDQYWVGMRQLEQREVLTSPLPSPPSSPMHNVDGKDDCLTQILNPKPKQR